MIFTRELGGFSAEKTTERDDGRRETDQDASQRLEENSERFPSLFKREEMRDVLLVVIPRRRNSNNLQRHVCFLSCEKPAKDFPTHELHSLKQRDKTRVDDGRESQEDVKNFDDWRAHVCLHVLLIFRHQMIGSLLIWLSWWRLLFWSMRYGSVFDIN